MENGLGIFVHRRYLKYSSMSDIGSSSARLAKDACGAFKGLSTGALVGIIAYVALTRIGYIHKNWIFVFVLQTH